MSYMFGLRRSSNYQVLNFARIYHVSESMLFLPRKSFFSRYLKEELNSGYLNDRMVWPSLVLSILNSFFIVFFFT